MKQIQRDHKVYGIHRKTDRQISRFEIRNKRSNDKRRLCKCIGWMDQYYWRKDDVILWYGEKCIKHVWMSDTRRTLLQKRRTKKMISEFHLSEDFYPVDFINHTNTSRDDFQYLNNQLNIKVGQKLWLAFWLLKLGCRKQKSVLLIN